MKHKVNKGINKQFIKLIAPSVILIIGFALSAYYLSNLSGEASSLPPPQPSSSTTATQTTTSQSMTPQTITSATQTSTQTSTSSVSTTSASSTTATQTTSTQTTSPTQTSTSQSSATTTGTTSTTTSTAVPTTTSITTSTSAPTSTKTTSKTTASTIPVTPSTFTTPTPAPTTSEASPYTPGSAEDIVYKGIIIEVKPQSSANFNSKIQIHIKAPIPNAPNGHKVTAEIHSEDPIVIPTEVANGNIEIDVNQYVSPGNHELYIKYSDPQDSSIFHTVIRKFIVNRVEAASALNSSQFDVNSVGILEIINPVYIYIIAAMVLASITVLFIIYKSRDTH